MIARKREQLGESGEGGKISLARKGGKLHRGERVRGRSRDPFSGLTKPLNLKRILDRKGDVRGEEHLKEELSGTVRRLRGGERGGQKGSRIFTT